MRHKNVSTERRKRLWPVIGYPHCDNAARKYRFSVGDGADFCQTLRLKTVATTSRSRITVGTRDMQPRFGDHTLSDLSVPDQYGFDHCGRRVLIGLSFRETCEFESLDVSLPFDGEHIWPAAGVEIARFPKERRWQELWTKHWMCHTSNVVIVD